MLVMFLILKIRLKASLLLHLALLPVKTQKGQQKKKTDLINMNHSRLIYIVNRELEFFMKKKGLSKHVLHTSFLYNCLPAAF